MAFFSEVKRWLSADFGGRYIGKIILEWVKDDNAGFKELIRNELNINLSSDYRIEEEFVYKKSRRADLAVFRKDQDTVPVVLIEIKWDDSLTEVKETGKTQLKDYVEYCLQHNDCCLLVLTKDSLSKKELVELKKLGMGGKHCYLGGLSAHLENSQSIVAKMFLDYLQDKGVVMNNIDQEGLFKFFHRFVNPYTGSNHKISENQLSNGPEQFRNMLSNMRLIAQDISSAFFEIKGINRKATIDFTFNPYFSQKKLTKVLKDAKEIEDDKVVLHPLARTGGEIFIHASENICKAPDPWTRIQYGFLFSVKPDKKHNLDLSVYSGFNTDREIDWVETESVKCSQKIKKLVFVEGSNNKSQLVSVFKNVICESIENAINKKLVSPAVSRDLKVVLKNLSN